MNSTRSFLSDNSSGAHPLVLQALIEANAGHAEAYGADPWTEQVEKVFAHHFGAQSKTFPVYSGTGANVLALACVTRSYQAILCSDMAHIHLSETGAPEKFTGCKIIPVASKDGKISPDSLKDSLRSLGSMHASQPSIVSISQASEVGTVYTLSEIKSLAEFSHQHGLKLHVDGARISNAAVALGCTFSEMILDTGVDLLSFGATKNGIFFGDAVTFLNPDLADGFLYLRKNGLQLASKMRFISAQLLAFFKDDLWKSMATTANLRAKELADGLRLFPEIEIAYPVQTNVVFANLPAVMVKPLQAEFPFHLWDGRTQARLMTSFDTTSEDIQKFLSHVGKLSRKV